MENLLEIITAASVTTMIASIWAAWLSYKRSTGKQDIHREQLLDTQIGELLKFQREEIQSMRNRLDEHAAKNDICMAKINDLEATVKIIKHKNEQLLEENRKLKNEVAYLETENITLKARVTELERELNELREKGQ
jgi:chromosome segregation ATPase